MINLRFYLALSLFLLPTTLTAKEPLTGPIIENFGPVYEIPEAGFRLDPEVRYRSVMDISSSPDDPSSLNLRIESAARFLNMHARDGVPASNMKMALVLHGAAAKDALSDEAYAKRRGIANPNTDLLAALKKAGVNIYLCGQSARFRGFANDELGASMTMATSAMTVLTRLQVEGWALLP